MQTTITQPAQKVSSALRLTMKVSVGVVMTSGLILVLGALPKSTKNQNTTNTAPSSAPNTNVTTTAVPTIAPDPNLKIAFFGDQGYNSNSVAVLNLIKNEGASAVVHLGDFDYGSNATNWDNQINGVLGANFPYFSIDGNHDVTNWPTTCTNTNGCYATKVKDRYARLGITPDDDPDINDQKYALTYRGLKFVFVGQDNIGDSTYAPYITQQLTNDNHIWRICGWHKDQHAMQVGDKSDEMGWGVYENCKNLGAIIATGHEHSYERTKTLISPQNQTVDTNRHPLDSNGIPTNPNNLLVGPGRSFVFVSGLGGESIRVQLQCLPYTYPYSGALGCNYIWDKIYTSSQTPAAKYGALFITFNVDGQANKAHGYFKNINNEIIDEFDILNINADTANPTVTVTSPANGSTVSGAVNLSVTAADDVGVAGVQFKINGQNFGAEDLAAPYSIVWNSRDVPNGSYTVSAVARDWTGKTGASSSVTFNVSNSSTGGGGGGPFRIPE